MVMVAINGQRQCRSSWFEHAHMHCRCWSLMGLAAMPLMMARGNTDDDDSRL